jgi:hypothetical protein
MLGCSSLIDTIKSALFCPSVVRIQIEPLPSASPNSHQHPAMEKTQPRQRQQHSCATGTSVSFFPGCALHLTASGAAVVPVPPPRVAMAAEPPPLFLQDRNLTTPGPTGEAREGGMNSAMGLSLERRSFRSRISRSPTSDAALATVHHCMITPRSPHLSLELQQWDVCICSISHITAPFIVGYILLCV